MYIEAFCVASGFCVQEQAGFIDHETLTGDLHAGLIHYNTHSGTDMH